MSKNGVLKTLEYLSIATTLFLVCRLFVQRLHRSYRCFFAFLLVDLGGSVWGLFSVSDPVAVKRYVWGQSLRTILAAAVVLEIYRLALVDHQAIARAGHKFVVAALSIGIAVSAIQFYVQDPTPPGQNQSIRTEVLFEMAVGTTVLLLLAVVAGFLSWFPIQLRRNLVIYICGFVGFFAVQWGTRMAVFSRAQPDIDIINLFSFGLTQLCIFVWIFALTRSGENKTATIGPEWSPDRMTQLRRRLDDINRDLERFVR